MEKLWICCASIPNKEYVGQQWWGRESINLHLAAITAQEAGRLFIKMCPEAVGLVISQAETEENNMKFKECKSCEELKGEITILKETLEAGKR